MPKPSDLLVVNVAALSMRMLKEHADHAPNLARLAEQNLCSMTPVLPAVTVPMQATLTTGVLPARHGMVANGIYQRAHGKFDNWEQPNALLCGAPRFWDRARLSRKDLKVAMLFWQNSKYGSCDYVITPEPLHLPSGDVSYCYGEPAGYYEECVGRLGPFELMWYWGPMTNFKGSRWIADCTLHTLRAHKPGLALCYLPHLDYSAQKFGPSSPQTLADLKLVDGLIGELAMECEKEGRALAVLSEYAIKSVVGAVAVNRVLARAGLLRTWTVKETDFLDAAGSEAFCMVDHQIAHCFVRNRSRVAVVKALFEKVPGVGRVLDKEGKEAAGINHERAGELVLLAKPDHWFSYYWFENPARAPGFTRGVDIHQKPGYDPLEMFFDPATKSISQNESLIKGSHGLVSNDPLDKPVFLASGFDQPKKQIGAAEVAGVLERLLTGEELKDRV